MASVSMSPHIDEGLAAAPAVRPITDHEVAFFVQNGWVLLKGLVPPDQCRAMLERGKARLAPHLEAAHLDLDAPGGDHMKVASAGTEGTVSNLAQWLEWRGPVRAAHEAVFEAVTLSSTMGHNVQRLLERNRPMRVYHDIFVCKLPDEASTRTDWHQDATNFALDRNVLTCWIALDEITPDQGPVQFFSGSHRQGLLGGIPSHHDFDLVDEYPELARFLVSPAHHLQPGDCTVHHGLVVHGAGANRTPRPRWSYLASYFPADARYTGAPNHDTDGFGLKRGDTLDDPSFSLVPE